MKHQWIVYVVVVLLSIGAGVAIAGLPDNSSESAPIPPATTVETTTTLPADPVETTEPEPVDTTEPDEPDPSDSTDVSAPDTTAPDTAVDTTEPDATDTTEPDSTESTTPALPPRESVAVVVANGAGEDGLAGRTAEPLIALGWTNMRTTTGLDVLDTTTVYYLDGFEASASQLAVDLGLSPDAIAPVAFAPELAEPLLAQLIAYLGTDRA